MTNFDETNTGGRTKAADAIKENIKSTTLDAANAAKQKATEKLDQNRDVAAKGIESIANAARAAASNLEEQNQGGLSRYVTELADSISSLAGGLRNKNVDELIRDAEGIARKNPALFIGGSIAIGLGLGRFVRASSRNTDTQLDDTQGTDFNAQRSESLISTGYTATGVERGSSTNSDFANSDIANPGISTFGGNHHE